MTDPNPETATDSRERVAARIAHWLIGAGWVDEPEDSPAAERLRDNLEVALEFILASEPTSAPEPEASGLRPRLLPVLDAGVGAGQITRDEALHIMDTLAASEADRATAGERKWEAQRKVIKHQRDLLAQAMWDVRAQFGFDTDGDDRYHTQDYGFISESFRRDMAEALDDLQKEASAADQDGWERGHGAALTWAAADSVWDYEGDVSRVAVREWLNERVAHPSEATVEAATLALVDADPDPCDPVKYDAAAYYWDFAAALLASDWFAAHDARVRADRDREWQVARDRLADKWDEGRKTFPLKTSHVGATYADAAVHVCTDDLRALAPDVAGEGQEEGT